MLVTALPIPIDALRTAFGEQLKVNAPLAQYTSARIGGPAKALLTVRSTDELMAVAIKLWDLDVEFRILGGGSNVLVSDLGVRELVVINRARMIKFEEEEGAASVQAESGANFGTVARQAAKKGYSGLEWAAGIPGTVGGAVFGNAGAHGGDVLGSLSLAEILHHTDGRQSLRLEELDYEYRSSSLKRQPGEAIILSAVFKLEQSTPDLIDEKMALYLAQRRKSQPPGASMGSMFKNPPGDYAGRLIEAAGLKGTQVGAAQISKLHGNFFINKGDAKAADVLQLIEMSQDKVRQDFGIKLELEIELIGEWNKSESYSG